MAMHIALATNADEMRKLLEGTAAEKAKVMADVKRRLSNPVAALLTGALTTIIFDHKRKP